MRKPPPLGAPGVAEVVKQRCPQTHSLLLKVTKITMIIGIRAFSHTPTQGSNQNRPCTAQPQDLHFYQFQNLCGTGTLSHYSEYIHQVQSKQGTQRAGGGRSCRGWGIFRLSRSNSQPTSRIPWEWLFFLDFGNKRSGSSKYLRHGAHPISHVSQPSQSSLTEQ